MQVAITLVVLLGALVRFMGLDFGYPYRVHPDERYVEKMAHAAYDGKDVGFFAYPPALGNQIGTVARLVMSERPEQHEIRRLGRHVVWFVSVLGVIFAAIAGQLAAGRVAALLAASMMAFSPLVVEQSRYSLTDAPTAAFMALVALAGFWIYRRPGWLPYVVAGVAVGIAASYKYAGAFGGLFVLVGHVSSEKRWSPKFWLLLAGAGVLAGVVFLSLNHQIAMDPAAWWPKFVHHYGYYSESHGGFTSDHTWIHATHFTLAYGLGWGVSAAGLLGAAWLSFRNRCRDQLVALGCFLVGLLYLMLLASKPVFLARNLIHGLPFVFIGIAALLAMQLRQIKSVRSLGAAVALVMLAGLAHDAFLVGRHALALSGQDTRLRAAEWLRKNVARGQRVAGVGNKAYLPPPALAGIKMSYLPSAQMERVLDQKKFRYAVVTWGSLQRYFRDPDHAPEETDALRRQLTHLREAARSIAAFEGLPGPGSELFGSTVDIYHDPRIEIFELPAASGPPPPAR